MNFLDSKGNESKCFWKMLKIWSNNDKTVSSRIIIVYFIGKQMGEKG